MVNVFCCSNGYLNMMDKWEMNIAPISGLKHGALFGRPIEDAHFEGWELPKQQSPTPHKYPPRSSHVISQSGWEDDVSFPKIGYIYIYTQICRVYIHILVFLHCILKQNFFRCKQFSGPKTIKNSGKNGVHLCPKTIKKPAPELHFDLYILDHFPQEKNVPPTIQGRSPRGAWMIDFCSCGG